MPLRSFENVKIVTQPLQSKCLTQISLQERIRPLGIGMLMLRRIQVITALGRLSPYKPLQK